MAASEYAQPDYLPEMPFPGIEPFTYAHRSVFFSREQEVRALTRLTTMYRDVLLYSDSGTGKSSLLNAGLIPAAFQEGFQPERIRVAPRPGGEIIVERIPTQAGGGPPFLPSVFVSGGQQERAVMPVHDFLAAVRGAGPAANVLLIFDQFEEWYTLFEEGPPDSSPEETRACQTRIQGAILSLIGNPTLPVTVLISLREDYLAKLNPFFQACPTLPDHYLRLTHLNSKQVSRTIRGPFAEYPGRYFPELSPELAAGIVREFESRPGAEISLTEVQIVCRSLFEAGSRGTEPQESFRSQGGVRGILENYLRVALEKLGREQHAPAISLLTHMITSAGTRNVISEDDLVSRVIDEEQFPDALLRETLNNLEREAKLVRRERRREVYYYEIASEFLVDWIREKAVERKRVLFERKRDEERKAAEKTRRAKRIRWAAALLAAGMAVVSAVAGSAVVNARDARRARELEKRARAEEMQARLRAEKRETEAQASRREADRARGEEAKARNEAEAKTREVSRLAMRRKLTAAALNSLELDPERGILLLLQAFSPSYSETGSAISDDEQEALRRALERSRIVLTIRPQGGVARAVAFSPDGRRLATANSDGTARIWEAATGREQLAFYGHAGAVNSVAFSPSGALLATGSEDGRAKVWDARTARELRTLSGHLDAVTAVAFLKEDLLVTASADATARIWTARSGTVVQTLAQHTGAIRSVAPFPDGRRLVTVAEDRNAMVWDTASGHRLLTLQTDRNVSAAAVRGDGGQLALADYAGAVSFWDARSGRGTGRPINAHSNTILDLSYSPDDRQIATAAYDGSVRVWDVKAGRELYSLAGHTNPVYRVAFSRDGKRVATSGFDRTVRLWSASPRSAELELQGHGDDVESIAYSPDSRLLATAASDSTSRLWDAASGSEVRVLKGHTGSVRRLAFSPDGKLLVTAGSRDRDEKAVVWDVASGRPLCSLQGHVQGPAAAVFSPDGARVATAGYDRTARIWDVHSCAPLITIKGHTDYVLAVAFSPDGKYLATASKDATARLWDAATGQAVGKPMADQLIGLLDVVFDPSGRRLLTAAKDRTARVWEIPSGRLLHTLGGHTDSVTAAVFSPGGRRIATGGLDKTVRLWDTASGRELQVVLQGPEEINALAFSPDGRHLAAAGNDGWAAAFPLSSGELLAMARQRVSRTLTEEECRHNLGQACAASALDLMAEGRALAERLQLKPAREKFHQALAQDPSLGRNVEKEADRVTAAAMLGASMRLFAAERLEEKDAELAARALLTAVKLDPSIRLDLEAHLKRLAANRLFRNARRRAAEDRVEDAANLLERAVKLDPTLGLEPRAAARRMAAVDRFMRSVQVAPDGGAEAIKGLEQALDLDPAFALAHRFLATFYSSGKRYGDAIRHARTAFELQPDPDMLFEFADVYRDSKRYSEAAALAEKGIRQFPEHGCGRYRLGLIRNEAGQYREAVAEFLRVADDEPCYENALAFVAAIELERLGEYEMAYRTSKQLEALRPDDNATRANLAEATLATGRYEEAYKLAQQVLDGSPDIPNGLAMRFIIAASLMLRNQAETARERIAELVDFYNRSPADARPGWNYTGTQRFINNQSMPAARKAVLLKLVDALQNLPPRIDLRR